MLEELVHRPATLLARTLYYAGLVGVTPVWTKINCMSGPAPQREPDSPESRGEEARTETPASLMATIHDYLRQSLHRYWTGEPLRPFNAALAAA
eukprot:2022217-Rhodomonas_salina.1